MIDRTGQIWCWQTTHPPQFYLVLNSYEDTSIINHSYSQESHWLHDLIDLESGEIYLQFIEYKNMRFDNCHTMFSINARPQL